jgi:osmotically-inducible protein OsmY
MRGRTHARQTVLSRNQRNRNEQDYEMKNSMSRVIQPLCLGAIVIGLMGCTSTENRYGRSTGRYIDDQKIASEVKDALQHDPLYKFGQVQTAAYRGTVQLSGFVLNDAQKQRAGDLATRVPGVFAVENNISIAPDPLHARDVDESRTKEGRQPVRERETTDPTVK